jgi:hypothetical protein
MVATPNRLAAGVTTTDFVAPDPEITIPEFGISVVLLEVPETVNDATAVSRSLTVKDNDVVAPSSLIV